MHIVSIRRVSVMEKLIAKMDLMNFAEILAINSMERSQS